MDLEVVANPAHPEHDNLRNARLAAFDDASRRSGCEGADRDDGDAVGADVAEACPDDDREH